MKLLAIETSTDIGTVAISADEHVEERRIPTPRAQTERVLPLIDELLSAAGQTLADLDGIAFGRGPGSFTGLRVAAAVAQGLSLAADLPLLPVSSLAAMAQGIWRTRAEARSLVCIDARMGEVFWAAYEIREELAELIGEERLSEPGAVAWTNAGSWGAVGSGFEVYETILADALAEAGSIHASFQPSATDLLPRALADLRRGKTQLAQGATPVYLRDETAWQN